SLAGFLSDVEAKAYEPLSWDVSAPRELFKRASVRSAKHARAIDAAVTGAFGERLTSDPDYDLESDASYRIDEVISSMSAESQERLLDETGRDFARAGKMSRSLVRA